MKGRSLQLWAGHRYRSKEGEGRQGSRRSPPLATPGWGRRRGPEPEPELGLKLELELGLELGEVSIW